MNPMLDKAARAICECRHGYPCVDCVEMATAIINSLRDLHFDSTIPGLTALAAQQKRAYDWAQKEAEKSGRPLSPEAVAFLVCGGRDVKEIWSATIDGILKDGDEETKSPISGEEAAPSS